MVEPVGDKFAWQLWVLLSITHWLMHMRSAVLGEYLRYCHSQLIVSCRVFSPSGVRHAKTLTLTHCTHNFRTHIFFRNQNVRTHICLVPKICVPTFSYPKFSNPHFFSSHSFHPAKPLRCRNSSMEWVMYWTSSLMTFNRTNDKGG